MQPVASIPIALRPSRRIEALLAFAYSAALFGILLAQLPLWLMASLLVCLGVPCIRRIRHRRLDCPAGLMLYGDGRFVKVGAGETALQLDATSTSLGPLIILRYRENGRMRSLVLFQDSFAEADDLRRFRRWYLCQARPEAVSGPA